MRRRTMLRLSFACILLLAPLSGWSQWQLPPGTSSSSSEAPQAGASASAGPIAAAEHLFEKADWAGAADLLRPVVAQDPKNAHAQYDLGFALDNAGHPAQAQDAYEAAAAAAVSAPSSRTGKRPLR